MKRLFPYNKRAFGLLEVIIAVLIIVGAGIPILRMVTGSRKETSSSLNYLRAMELANEAIEWASAAKFDEVDKLKNISGSNTTKIERTNWKNSDIFEENLKYSEQYSTAFFYRKIEVEPIKGSYFADNLIKKVTVTVLWSEGYKPSNINVEDDRSRQVQLSILIINDDNLLY